MKIYLAEILSIIFGLGVEDQIGCISTPYIILHFKKVCSFVSLSAKIIKQ